MTDAEQLTPAKPKDLGAAFYALQFDGRMRTRRADEMMARIVAERPVAAFEPAGFVIGARDPKATR